MEKYYFRIESLVKIRTCSKNANPLQSEWLIPFQQNPQESTMRQSDYHQQDNTTGHDAMELLLKFLPLLLGRAHDKIYCKI